MSQVKTEDSPAGEPAVVRHSLLTPPPSTARPDLAARIDAFTMNSPVVKDHRMPSPPMQDEQSFFAQNRAILLSGLPLSPRASLSPPQQQQKSRRLRGPPRRLTPLVTSSALSATTTVADAPAPSPRVVSACVYVRATSLRQQSAAPSPRPSSEFAVKMDESPAPLPGSLADNKLYICAFVRPCSDDRPPYAIQRVVDRDALLRSLPRADGRFAASVNILPSPAPRSPLIGLSPYYNFPSPGLPRSKLHTATTATAAVGASSPVVSPYTSARRPSRQHVRRHSHADVPPSPANFHGDSGTPIPIRPHSAFGVIPGLAAVILSGHIRPGDTIEQPMPHPEAWQETISYAYQAHGALSEAVRQNIEHLGGQVE